MSLKNDDLQVSLKKIFSAKIFCFETVFSATSLLGRRVFDELMYFTIVPNMLDYLDYFVTLKCFCSNNIILVLK